jgi:hypothetical protein
MYNFLLRNEDDLQIFHISFWKNCVLKCRRLIGTSFYFDFRVLETFNRYSVLYVLHDSNSMDSPFLTQFYS